MDCSAAVTTPLNLSLLRAGDQQAWTEAFRQLWPVVLRTAGHPAACLTVGEAEEVASEALAQLVPRVNQVASGEALKALAATIAHRRAISLARAKSAAKRGPASLSLSQCPDEGGFRHDGCVPANDGLTDLELSEMALLLARALDGLDAGARALLEEKIGEGRSYQELSAKYRIPIGTLCPKVSRSLGHIRKQLENSPQLMKELMAFLR
jgi:RNA polymerase sigma factor (sigma-70 family)